MSKHIEIIARGVCVKRGKILLCHTKGAWNTFLPGGHVEFKEEAADSLEREIREEMGRKAKTGRFLGGAEHTFKQKGRRHCEINLVFEVGIPRLSPPRAPRSREDYIEFLWAPLSQLRRHKLEPAVLCASIPQWLKAAKGTARWASSPR